MGTSDTFINLPIFDTYQIQKKVSKYRTAKVSEDRRSGHQILTFDSPILFTLFPHENDVFLYSGKVSEVSEYRVSDPGMLKSIGVLVSDTSAEVSED
jgi:hypothetical protein